MARSVAVGLAIGAFAAAQGEAMLLHDLEFYRQGTGDNRFTPQNKPAQHTLTRWYDRLSPLN